MTTHARPHPRFLSLTGLVLVLLAGCQTVGPASIRSGRAVYNEAIAVTNDQQLLNAIVRIRYGEPASLLGVAAITANVRISGRVGTNVGLGPESSFSGNLVPLSARVVYEENPTISYIPVQGEKYIRELLSPVPIDLTLLMLLNGNASPDDLLTLMVKSINGIRNPNVLTEAEPRPDPRFTRIADLMTELDRAGRLTWTKADGGEFALVLHGHLPQYRSQVRDLLTLLGLPLAGEDADPLQIPVTLGIGAVDGTIVLEARSVYGMLIFTSAAIEVPEEDLESGLTLPRPDLGPIGELIRIRWSRNAPRNAMVAVPHRDGWFFIDHTDHRSKRCFRALEVLVTVRIADTVNRGKGSPVLTVPVSR